MFCLDSRMSERDPGPPGPAPQTLGADMDPSLTRSTSRPLLSQDAAIDRAGGAVADRPLIEPLLGWSTLAAHVEQRAQALDMRFLSVGDPIKSPEA